MEDVPIFMAEFFSLSLRTLSFVRPQDSIASSYVIDRGPSVGMPITWTPSQDLNLNFNGRPLQGSQTIAQRGGGAPSGRTGPAGPCEAASSSEGTTADPRAEVRP